LNNCYVIDGAKLSLQRTLSRQRKSVSRTSSEALSTNMLSNNSQDQLSYPVVTTDSENDENSVSRTSSEALSTNLLSNNSQDQLSYPVVTTDSEDDDIQAAVAASLGMEM